MTVLLSGQLESIYWHFYRPDRSVTAIAFNHGNIVTVFNLRQLTRTNAQIFLIYQSHTTSSERIGQRLTHQKVSVYDQEIPQSHTADQPTAP